jgi:hypothetical protein
MGFLSSEVGTWCAALDTMMRKADHDLPLGDSGG